MHQVGLPLSLISFLGAKCIVFHYVDIISWFRSRTWKGFYYLLFHTTFGCGGGTAEGDPGMEGEEALSLVISFNEMIACLGCHSLKTLFCNFAVHTEEQDL